MSGAVEHFDGTLDGMARIVEVEEEGLPAARRRVVELLRGEPGMGKLVGAYDKLTRKGKGHECVALDAALEKSGISRSEAVGVICRVMHQMNFEVAKTVVAAVCTRNAVPVAEKMVEAALDVERGHRDRRLFFEAARVIDQRGAAGTQVNVNAQANNANVSASQAVVVVGRELPSFEEGQKRMAAALRQLPAEEDEPYVLP